MSNNKPFDLVALQWHVESANQVKQPATSRGQSRRKRASFQWPAPLGGSSERTDLGAQSSDAIHSTQSPMPVGYQALGILRCPQVLALTGWSRSTLYNRIADTEFPPGVSTGPRTVGWPAAEVYAYLAARVEERNARIQRQRGASA